jgi:beta-lactamase regulating signal transducer with metallopeptidase domain
MGIFHMSLAAVAPILIVIIVRSFLIYRLPKKTFLVLWGVVLFRLFIPIPAGALALPPQVSVSLVLVIWGAGVTITALFFIVAHVRARKKYMSGLPVENDYVNGWIQGLALKRTVRVFYSDRINTPMTYGIWKPVILFPANTDWQDKTLLRYILTHESTHIRRFDVLVKGLLAAAVCVHWFNPLVWVMYVLANRDIELACDETVVWSCGEAFKSAYASALIELEEKKGRFSPLCNGFAKNAVEERIKAIMKFKRSSFSNVSIAVFIVTVMAAAAVTATMQPKEGEIEMRKMILACLFVLAGNFTLGSVDNPEYSEFDYVFYSYEEFRAVFPGIPADAAENQFLYTDEAELMLEVTLLSGETVEMKIIVYDTPKRGCHTEYEETFDSYEAFRAAFPLS